MTTPTSTSQQLETRARGIANLVRAESWRATPSSTVSRDLSLALEAIDDFETLHRDLESSLVGAECFIGTELMRPLRDPDRIRLQSELLSIQAERRKLALARHHELGRLTYRVATLLKQHTYLAVDDED